MTKRTVEEQLKEIICKFYANSKGMRENKCESIDHMLPCAYRGECLFTVNQILFLATREVVREKEILDEINKIKSKSFSKLITFEQIAHALAKLQMRKAPGLKIECDNCGEQLSEPGGLIFIPTGNPKLFEKIHLCKECSDNLELSEIL